MAFAVGGLLGDTLFHLLPEIFLGEDEPDRAKFVLVEPNRNLLLGLGILVGFMTFVAMDKGLRIATGGAGHEHSHAHSHDESSAVATGADITNGEVKSRKKGKGKKAGKEVQEKEVNPSVKLGGYLNLMWVANIIPCYSLLNIIAPTLRTTLPMVSPCLLAFTRRRLLAPRPPSPSSSTRYRTKSATLPCWCNLASPNAPPWARSLSRPLAPSSERSLALLCKNLADPRSLTAPCLGTLVFGAPAW